MHCRNLVLAITLTGVINGSHLSADDADILPVIRNVIGKSIPLLEMGMRGSAEKRQCFTCHNQAVPILALAEAQKRGFVIDEDNFERQLQHTTAHLERGRKAYVEGRGQGGKVLTAGYALWTLSAGDRPPSDTTAAVTSFLLNDFKATKHWSHATNRPPSSGSDFTATYLALRGLKKFGTEKQRPAIEARTKEASPWILSEDPGDTEDRVFRLLALPYIDATTDVIQSATLDLIDSQRDDGGWAQVSDMESDAYATGTVLVSLLRASELPADHPSVHRGIEYLLTTQLDDGSWHVATRAKPFQTYYESSFPHGKDQFISITASSWSTLALLLTLPESP